jgi:hypothetical protein
VTAQNARETTINMPWFLVPLPPVPIWKRLYSSPFAIEIVFWPEDDRFAFDPRATTLRIEDLPMITSSGFSRCAGQTETDAPFPMTQGACVLVKFDRQPPAPSEAFTLLVEGVTHDQVPLIIPPIKFEKVSTSSSRSWDAGGQEQ